LKTATPNLKTAKTRTAARSGCLSVALQIAQKFGEEAVETVIEAIAKRKGHLIEESADVLYFLLVMWKDRGIAPKDVWKELAKRHKMPEIEERAGRLK